MGLSGRQAAVFGSGLVLGVAAVGAWVVLNDRPPPPRVAADVTARPVAAAAPTAAPQARTDCGFEPIAAKGEEGDGQLPLPKDFSGKTGAELEAVLVAGKEAAAAGRARDAEVAFISACRAAKEASDQAMRLADAKYQLARHYALLAQSDGASKRSEMLQRAEKLYADSAFAFAARHGNGYDKVGFANQGLAAVRQALAQAGVPAQADTAAMGAAAGTDAKAKPSTPATVAAAPKPAPATMAAAPTPAPVPAPAPVAKSAAPKADPAPAAKADAAPADTDVVRAPARPAATAHAGRSRSDPAATAQAAKPRSEPVPVRKAPAPAGVAARSPKPSFDCSKARSASEKMICSDPELAQMDRDLGRVHARARAQAADGRAFQRESDREWTRREQECRDRECLVDWYAQRRAQLESPPAVEREPGVAAGEAHAPADTED